MQERLIPPRRGWIVDRYNQPIAINRSAFRVDLIPERMEKDPTRVLNELTQLLGLTQDDLDRIRDGLANAAGLSAGAGRREHRLRKLSRR